MYDESGIERSLGKLEGKIDALDAKIDAEFKSFTLMVHEMDKRLTVVEALALTPKKLLGILLTVASVGSIFFGFAVTLGDRLWGG